MYILSVVLYVKSMWVEGGEAPKGENHHPPVTLFDPSPESQKSGKFGFTPSTVTFAFVHHPFKSSLISSTELIRVPASPLRIHTAAFILQDLASSSLSMPRSNDDPRRHVQVLPEQVGAVSTPGQREAKLSLKQLPSRY